LRDLLSGKKHVTCSAIKLLIKLIGDKYVSPMENDTELTLEIRGCIKQDIESYYGKDEINLLCNMCSFLEKHKGLFHIKSTKKKSTLTQISLKIGTNVGSIEKSHQTKIVRETVPNRTSGKIKPIPTAYSHTTVLLVSSLNFGLLT